MGRRTKDSGIDGLLVVDKPVGLTSNDLVTRIRRITGQMRSGHSGTLDPDATGVMLVGFGRVTKLLPYLIDLGKSYRGEVVLGTETSTLDASGEVTATHDMSTVSVADVERVATGFVGAIEQVPPMVSAVHVKGKRLYEYAREGIEIERPVRHVTVHRLTVTGEVAPGVFGIDVACSSGTYIRSIAADIGTALGGGAHLRNLRRTSVGPFDESEAVPFDEITAQTPLLTPVQAMRGHRVVQLSHHDVLGCANGRLLKRAEVGIAVDEAGPWVAVGPDGAFVALLERFQDGLVKPTAAAVGFLVPSPPPVA